jgi:hypothetical protein
MINPYTPPEAKISSNAVAERSFKRATLALFSGLVGTPTIVITFAKIVHGNSANGLGNMIFWGSIGAGSILAALLCYQLPRIPVWLTLAIGPFAVVFIFSLYMMTRLFFVV